MKHFKFFKVWLNFFSLLAFHLYRNLDQNDIQQILFYGRDFILCEILCKPVFSKQQSLIKITFSVYIYRTKINITIKQLDGRER